VPTVRDRDADMSAQMKQRYGIRPTPWTTKVLVGVVVLAYAIAIGYVFVQLAGRSVESQLLVWTQPLPDRVDITFEVERRGGDSVTCVVRAQDPDRVDLGYATTDIEAGETYVQSTYSLRVLGPAAVVEVLTCVPSGEQLRVPGPQFPPGIVPPQQPWTDPETVVDGDETLGNGA